MLACPLFGTTSTGMPFRVFPVWGRAVFIHRINKFLLRLRPLTLLRICVCLFRRIGVAILLFGVLACWSRRALFSLRMVPLLLRSLLLVRLLLSRAVLSRWIWVLQLWANLIVSASWGK